MIQVCFQRPMCTAIYLDKRSSRGQSTCIPHCRRGHVRSCDSRISKNPNRAVKNLNLPTHYTGLPPEQEELAAKRKQLDELEAEYATRQMEYSTLASEIGAFRNRYYLRVGVLYAQLDTLRAEIKARIFSNAPDDVEAKQTAEKAQQQADETVREVNCAAEDEPVSFQPSADLKQLYRQAAKLIHPDRAKDEQDRQLRDRLMAEVNAAYAAGDIDAIHRIIERYRNQLDAPDVDDIGVQLVRVIRNIARTRNQIASLVQSIAELQASNWFKLKTEVEQGEANGENPLGELAEKIHAEILLEQRRLNELQSTPASNPEAPTETVERQGEVEAHEPPITPAFRPEGLIHRTERGEKVRSKSEAIIANILYNLGLDYRYEYPIEGQSQPGIRRPDFVFFTAERKPILWEHLGMLDNPDYRSRWQSKLAWYEANGFTQGVDLFITRDEVDGGLDSHRIRKVAEYIKTLLA